MTGALGAEAHAGLDAALIAHQQARHGERHVERVLAIVIERIDAVIARHAAGEELVEILERDRDLVERFAGPRRSETVHGPRRLPPRWS